MSNSFNFDEALKDLQAEKYLAGGDSILIPLIKQLKTKFYNKPRRTHNLKL